MKLWKALLQTMSVIVIAIVASVGAVMLSEFGGVPDLVVGVIVMALALVCEFMREEGKQNERKRDYNGMEMLQQCYYFKL